LTHKTIRVVAKVFKNLGRQIGLFFIGLLIAIPMSWMMEQLFRVSVIGYGSILAFCLMGEVFVNTTEIDGEFESKSN
jgi:sensor histidine kinase regulating citrate/malate metabolism